MKLVKTGKDKDRTRAHALLHGVESMKYNLMKELDILVHKDFTQLWLLLSVLDSHLTYGEIAISLGGKTEKYILTQIRVAKKYKEDLERLTKNY